MMLGERLLGRFPRMAMDSPSLDDSHGSLPLTLVVHTGQLENGSCWLVSSLYEKKNKKKYIEMWIVDFFGDYYKLDINQQILECSNVSVRYLSFSIWGNRYNSGLHQIYHWIGLRENLQETMVFTIKYRVVPVSIFPSSNSMNILN